MAFGLFLLLNAVLFWRPGDIFPEIQTWPLYELSILGCVLAAHSQLLNRLTNPPITEQPIALCLLGMLAAVVLSHLSHVKLWEARESASLFGKTVLYFFLFISIVDTPDRLIRFSKWLILFVSISATLAILQQYEVVNLPAFNALQQREFTDDEDDPTFVTRLVGTGLLNDPNDFAMMLASVIMLSLYASFRSPGNGFRLVWFIAGAVCLWAFVLTKSRGGFMALVAGLGVLLQARFGWKRTLMYAGPLLPVVLLLFGGRQTDLGAALQNDTGQSRIQLWSEGFTEFKQQPLFGIGFNEFVENIGHVAHNSFVQCYTELGFVGGTLFFGLFFYSIRGLWLLKDCQDCLDPRLFTLQPFVLAALVSYSMGLMSLSRSYAVTTYVILGLASTQLELARPTVLPVCEKVYEFRPKVLVVASAIFLTGLYLLTRSLVRFT